MALVFSKSDEAEAEVVVLGKTGGAFFDPQMGTVEYTPQTPRLCNIASRGLQQDTSAAVTQRCVKVCVAGLLVSVKAG